MSVTAIKEDCTSRASREIRLRPNAKTYGSRDYILLVPYLLQRCGILLKKLLRKLTIGSLAFLILLTPPRHDRLRKEILEHVGSEVDIQQLPYLTGVVKEGMRLAPANARLPRVVPENGWHFDGHYFPPGTVVGVAPPQLFMNPEVYQEPMAFRPERWAKPSTEMQRDLTPFSVGIRQCIAKNLATAELFMAVKQVAESDVLRGAQPHKDKIETYEWFNMAFKGNRVDLVWPQE